MREQLIQYVNLLFAGTPDCEDIRQEILQNTLDRYDDLISQGKSPEAAYRLAISGIGDINEILSGGHTESVPVTEPVVVTPKDPKKEKQAKIANAIAVALYVTCPVPLFITGGTIGLCLLLAMVAGGIALQMIYNDEQDENSEKKAPVSQEDAARKKLHQSISGLTWAIGVAVYFIVSFFTKAWYITWMFFPIIGCVGGLINAIIDLKEAN